VDDNESLLEGVSEALRQEGHQVVTCTCGSEATALCGEEEFAVAVVDMKLPDISGLALLKEIKARHPETEVIVITAYGTIDVAVEAMRAGAFDFITKPFPVEEILMKVQRARERHSLQKRVRNLSHQAEFLKGEMRTYYDPDGLIGESDAMRAIKGDIARLAGSKAAVLILGETGTGKELIARAIHDRSSRRDGPFVRVNCAAFAETLLESELFGHEKGAFTGAHARKPGRFELADGGTIFLDEIAELSPPAQAKILRVLQEEEFERVGGTETLKVDVRVIAATNRDLAALVEEGRFREDLFYRLNVVPLVVPPLRERKEDIPVLIDHFLRRYAQENHKRVRGFTKEALEAIMAYHWPGNVRELENAVERGVVLTEQEWIGPELLPFQSGGGAERSEGGGGLVAKVEAYERKLIARALAASGGNTSRAAEILGVSRSTLRYKIKKYSL